MVYDMFMDNFITLVLLVGLVLLIITGDVFDKKIERYFAIGALCVIVLVISDIADSLLSQRDTLSNWRYISSAVGYTVRPIALGVFITVLLRKSDNIYIIWIPIAVIALISFTSIFTHIMFYFTEDNEFRRGPLGYVAHFLSFFYMTLLMYFSIRRFKVTDLGEIFTILYILLINVVAVFIETVSSQKFLVSGAVVTSSTIYYTYLYVQVYKTDTLTGVFNRTSFQKDSRNRYSKEMCLICVDLDNLKNINDKEGHVKGDEAICKVSDALVSASGNRFRVYRYGGDEFLVLGINKDIKSAKKFIEDATKILDSTEFSASFGYSFYYPGNSFDEACSSADQNMYKQKLQKKNANK